MDTRWCEHEFEHVPSDEIESFGGVSVHKRDPWHLLTGEVIEMASDGNPELSNGIPVTDLAPFDSADAPFDDLDRG